MPPGGNKVFSDRQQARCLDKFGIDLEQRYRDWVSELTGRYGDDLEEFIELALRETPVDEVIVGATITPAQRRVLFLLAQGLRREEAAEVLGVSRWTVKEHLEDARDRMGARTITHAVAIAVATGLLNDR